MKWINNLTDDLLFLFKGVGILLLVIIIGIGLSKMGIDSLTNHQQETGDTSLTLLDNGSYQLTFLGEKIQTPPAIQLGQIENKFGQVTIKFGKHQWVFNTTLQIGQVEVLFKITQEKIFPYKAMLTKTIRELGEYLGELGSGF